jgi:hypothetical protein
MKLPTFSTFGLIIAYFESGEKDKIFRMLGEATGKISFIAKRCRGQSINYNSNNTKNNSAKKRTTTTSTKKYAVSLPPRSPDFLDYGLFYLRPSRTNYQSTIQSHSVFQTDENSQDHCNTTIHNVEIHNNGGLYVLQNESQIYPPLPLNDTISKIILSAFVAEMIDYITTDNNAEEGLYLEPTLGLLNKISNTSNIPDGLRVIYYGSIDILSRSGFGLPRQLIQNTPPPPTKRKIRSILEHLGDIRGYKLKSLDSVELLLGKI